MSVLSYWELLTLAEPNRQSIDPVINAPVGQIGASSIDLTLSSSILVEEPMENGVPHHCQIDGWGTSRMREYSMNETGYVVQPGEFILAATKEKFCMPCNLSAQYIMRSSVARLGLEQLNACWIRAGFRGVLVLELKNMTRNHTLLIKPGDCIGQVVFFEHKPVPEAAMEGRYNNQCKVVSMLPELTVLGERK